MARKKFSLEALQSAFDSENKERKNTSGGKFYNFFNMDFDESCTIRFLPDLNEDNPKQFLIEKKMHRLEINGETETVPCLTMYGEDCPICATAKGFYDEDDAENGKKFYRSLNHVGQVLVVKDPLSYDDKDDTSVGKVKAISISWQIFQVMKESFGELEGAPHDFDEGTDFIIKKTKNGKWAKYDLGTKFARNERELSEDELEAAEEGMIDLSEYLPEKPSLAKIQAKLKAALTGGVYEEDDDEEEEEEAPKPKTKKSKKKPAPVVEEDEEEEEEEDEDEDEDEDEEAPKPKKKKKSAPVVEEDEEEEEDDDADDDADDEDEDEDSSNVLAQLRARRAKMKK